MFIFSFDPRKYRELTVSVPNINFTCTALAKNSLPKYLQFCYKCVEFLINYEKKKGTTIPFFDRVPDDQVSAPDYYNIIKHPMELSTIKQKILNEEYPDIESFKADVDLIWSNCLTYNGPEHKLTKDAMRVKMDFDSIWKNHKKITDPTKAIEAIELLSQSRQNAENAKMTFTNTYKFPNVLKLPREIQQAQQIAPVRVDTNISSFKMPSDELLHTEMTTEEKYKLANDIDTMSIELLGDVLQMLKEATGFSPGEPILIPFSSLETPVLRKIEAYIQTQIESKAETNVRNVFQKEKIRAQDQLKTIEEEINKIKRRLEEVEKISEVSSESEGDTEGDSDASSGSYEYSDDE